MFKHLRLSKLAVLTILFFIFSFHTAQAAELSLVPSSGSYSVGDTIRVRVVLSSSGQSANAVSSGIIFSNDLLTLTSVSKDNSLISIWPVEPSYSNSSGTANMEGVILNGYSGSNGTIATLIFRAKASGSATVKFTNTSSVLANDGQGSNILYGKGQAAFNISAAKETTVTPVKPAPLPEEEEEVVERVATPVFTDYSKEIGVGEYLVIKGEADPSVDILINSDSVISATDAVVHESAILRTDKAGEFIYVSEKRVEGGIYVVSAQARNNDGVLSEKNTPVKISVDDGTLSRPFWSRMMNMFSLAVPVTGLLILLILLMIWGWYHVLHYREHMQKKLADARNVVSKSFDVLDEDVSEEVKIFKKVKGLHPLTENERAFLSQFKKDIEDAERAILNKIR